MRINLEKGNIGFSAAHFIVGHEKCGHLHGHNWKVGVSVEGKPDERGLLVDFIKLKKKINEICNRYDHRLLLPEKNPGLKIEFNEGKTIVNVRGKEFKFPSEDVVCLPVVNTTVEEIVRIIVDELVESLAEHENIKKITARVEESPGQSACVEKVMDNKKNNQKTIEFIDDGTSNKQWTYISELNLS